MSAQAATLHLPSTPAVAIARQPIHDRRTRVVGYALTYRETDGQEVDEQHASTSVIVETFTCIGASRLVGRHPAHVRVTRPFLLELHAFALPPEGVVLELVEPDAADAELCTMLARLAEQGYRISLVCRPDGPVPTSLLGVADSVKLDVSDLTESEIATCAERFRGARHTLLAAGVDTPELLSHCRVAGFAHFQGFFFFCAPDTVAARRLPTGRVAELRSVAGLYAQGTTFEQFEQVIARDVGLSYRLLCYLNSAYFNLRREILSVREALTMLGLQRVRRWATLITLSSTQDKPHELTVTALVRARLCELLGRLQPVPAPPGAAFTVGLFSVMDAILDVPLAEALAPLPLAEEVRVALLERRGPIGDALAAVLAYERGELEIVTHRLPGVALGELYLTALDWADAACGALVEVQEREADREAAGSEA